MFAKIFFWFFASFGNAEKMGQKWVEEIPIPSVFCPAPGIRLLRGIIFL
jgi:hypothetical protein